MSYRSHADLGGREGFGRRFAHGGEVEAKHQARCYMRFPETAHYWAGVEKADWKFKGDEVLVETER